MAGAMRGQPVAVPVRDRPAPELPACWIVPLCLSESHPGRPLAHCGIHLCDAMAMDLRGMPMTSLFAPSERRRCSDWLDQILAQPAIGEMTLIGQDATVHARMLVLPLRSDHGSSRAGFLVAWSLRQTPAHTRASIKLVIWPPPRSHAPHGPI